VHGRDLHYIECGLVVFADEKMQRLGITGSQDLEQLLTGVQSNLTKGRTADLSPLVASNGFVRS